MKIVVAPDAFKGSLTAVEASDAIASGISNVNDKIKFVKKPMADGGEGTLEAVQNVIKGEVINLKVTGALGDKKRVHYIKHQKTAIIEYAHIAGLIDLPKEKQNPDYTTSYGLGEVILDAIEKGCTDIQIGIGGSATMDGGLGMLQALGMKAYNHKQDEIGIFGKDLHELSALDFNFLNKKLKDVSILVACDVSNPLTGKEGAAFVYGPQKGATSEQVQLYNDSLQQLSRLIKDERQNDYMMIKGAGAAGGLGFALLVLGAELIPGASFIGEIIGLENAISHADFVITGEGQSDEQTLYGKAPGYVADLAKKHHKPTILISGSLSKEEHALNEVFLACFSITNRPMDLSQAIQDASDLLTTQTEQVVRLINYQRKILS